MPISDDHRFAFDIQGFLHLRDLLTPAEIAETSRWMAEGEKADVHALNPGSHRARFEIATEGRVDLPGQHVFDDVRTGDVILFNEALLHNGRPNTSATTRKTLIINFGRVDAGVWKGYSPLPATLEAV